MFKREPALYISALSALLAVFVGFGVPGLTEAMAGGITAFLTAAAAAWVAWKVQPVAPAVFTGAISTGATLLGTFGLELSQQQVGLLAAVATTVVTLIVRQQVTPVADPQPTP